MKTKPITSPIVACVLLVSACKTLEMNSLRPDREILIDGSDSEWGGANATLEKANVSVGFFNDANSLALCLVCTDRARRVQILDQGLIVWFDPNGGNAESFGVQFPVGMMEKGMSIRALDQEEDGPDPFQMQKWYDFYQSQMEIFGQGAERGVWFPLGAVPGIQVKVGFDTGKVVYELKVPLVRTERFVNAVGVDTGRTVSVGIETPELETGRMGRGMPRSSSAPGGSQGGGGTGSVGGRGGRGGSRGGSRGGGGGTEQPAETAGGGEMPGPSMSDPFKLWIKVRLAPPDSTVRI
jgi:hypothetical protein